MANKVITLDRNGKVLSIKNEGVDVEESFVHGSNVVIVPESLFSNSINVDNPIEGVDPRTEIKLQMQRGDLGTGCTAGITAGITGCGTYQWNETVSQNVSLVDTRHRGSSTKPVSDTSTKKFGTSSINFKGLDGGDTGGILLMNDIPGLTLAGPGGHIGGGSGASGAGVSGGYSGDVLLQMYFYLDATPSADRILAMQGSSAAGGTGNSWKLYYDHSSTSLKFDFNNMGDSPTAWAHSMTVTAGVPVINKWHHCAIIYKSRWYPSNVSEVIPYYDNTRNETGLSSGVINELLRSDQPLSIGGGQSGAFPFDGWIDDFHLQIGPSGGTVCRGFSGATYVTADVAATMDSYSTVALVRGNGSSGCGLFSLDSFEKVSAKVTFWDSGQKILGVRDIKLTGNAVNGFDYAYGHIEGSKGNGHYQISCTGGTFMSGTQKRDLRQSQVRLAQLEYLGLAGLSGNSGGSGDLKHLYGLHGSVGHGEPKFVGNDADGFSIRVNKNTMMQVNDMVNYIQCLGGTSGTGGNFLFQDTLGNATSLSAGHVTSLHQDLFVYRNNLRENVINANSEIEAGTTNDSGSFSEISSINLNTSGIDAGGIVGFDPEGSPDSYGSGVQFSTSQVSEKFTTFSTTEGGK